MEKTVGYQKFCSQMNILNAIVEKYDGLNKKTLFAIYSTTLKKADTKEKQNANKNLNGVCHLADNLMQIMQIKKITRADMQKFNDTKDFIYRTFFQKEYEPLVETK